MSLRRPRVKLMQENSVKWLRVIWKYDLQREELKYSGETNYKFMSLRYKDTGYVNPRPKNITGKGREWRAYVWSGEFI